MQNRIQSKTAKMVPESRRELRVSPPSSSHWRHQYWEGSRWCYRNQAANCCRRYGRNPCCAMQFSSPHPAPARPPSTEWRAASAPNSPSLRSMVSQYLDVACGMRTCLDRLRVLSLQSNAKRYLRSFLKVFLLTYEETYSVRSSVGLSQAHLRLKPSFESLKGSGVRGTTFFDIFREFVG